MIYMNAYDVMGARQRASGFPTTLRAIEFLEKFIEEVNAHSDGWAYWQAPCKAAQKLQALIKDATGGTVAPLKKSRNITEVEFSAALVPIKAFYTRVGKAAGMEVPFVFTPHVPDENES